MDFEIQQLLPAWFTGTQSENSQVWLQDLSFRQGELIEIVAPSGSGKTSLIHFLYGLRSDYKGVIRYNKKELSSAGHEAMSQYRKDHLSVVFQDMRLFNGLSVFQNIEIKRQLAPFHEQSPVKEMASRLGIADKLDALCGLTMGPACAIDSIYGDRWGDVFLTSPAAMAGYPHISVPGGFVYGLPVGMSFYGTAWSEGKLLGMAYAFELAMKGRQRPEFREKFELG